MDAARTILPTHAVLIDPPASVLAERHRLGLDRFDEVWDGEHHMVPGPAPRHGRIELALVMALLGPARRHGLEVLHEQNLLLSEAAGFGDFRIPDVVAFRPEQEGRVGVIGPIALAVEIRSPGDESFQKLPFYERLGVGEVLIIDRDTALVRRWVLTDGVLAESPGEPVGKHRLGCIPVSLHDDEGVLVITTPDDVTRV